MLYICEDIRAQSIQLVFTCIRTLSKIRLVSGGETSETIRQGRRPKVKAH